MKVSSLGVLLLGSLLLVNCNPAKMEYESFDTFPVYEGNDLGVTYAKHGTTFKLWSPEAEAVQVHLYNAGLDSAPLFSLPLDRSDAGVWTGSKKEDLEGWYYTFQVKINGRWLNETPGPYVRATGANGQRGYILDLATTDPEGWQNDSRPNLKSFNDIIIYEVHLRDISIDPNSGIKFKGKYLGLTEKGTTSKEGESTGIDHLVDLGITHVHILPMFDFRSIDETKLEENKFNWGYEPQNFNVPEGSYSTDPFDPATRIKEMKQMVQALHKSGIRVIMDVVYNHVGFGEPSADNFSLAAPGYYYRTNQDGTLSNASACGNETASERPMMRKYIRESVDYWVKQYHVDGFRFDLMGIHDVETMNIVSQHLTNIDPTIFVYGEGWKAGSSPINDEQLALKKNVPKLQSVAAFSDEIRDGLKGSWHDWEAPGYVSGNVERAEGVKFGIVGGVKHDQIDYVSIPESDAPWAPKASQCIVYVSCHDNHTLYDKLKIVSPDASEETILKQHILANTVVLTSQGIPFLHAGVDFVRTKNGVENSYDSPDSVNQIIWSRKSEFKEVHEYYKALISLRKKHPVFRMDSQQRINKNLRFLENPNMIVYQLNGAAVNDSWKNVIVLINGNESTQPYKLPEGNWRVTLDEMFIGSKPIKNTAYVGSYSAMILVSD